MQNRETSACVSGRKTQGERKTDRHIDNIMVVLYIHTIGLGVNIHQCVGVGLCVCQTAR